MIPFSSTSSALELVVPWSKEIIYFFDIIIKDKNLNIPLKNSNSKEKLYANDGVKLKNKKSDYFLSSVNQNKNIPAIGLLKTKKN
jgi:hypothetical protein